MVCAVKETKEADRPALFMQKLEICCVRYSFDENIQDADLIAKRETKRQVLLEIIDYINGKGVLTDDKLCIACVDMVRHTPRACACACGSLHVADAAATPLTTNC